MRVALVVATVIVFCVGLAGFSSDARALPGWILGKSSEDLGSAHVAERKRAALCLSRWGPHREGGAAIVEALSRENDATVRIVLLEALARRPDPRAHEELVKSFRSVDPREREIASIAISANESEEGIDFLLDSLSDPVMRGAARRGIERLGGHAWPKLVAALDRPDARDAVAGWLGASKREEAGPILRAALKSTPAGSRASILRALGQLGDRDSATVILAELESPSREVVEAALLALADVGSAQHAPRIVRKLSDPALAEVALKALLALDPTAAAEACLAVRKQDVSRFLTLAPTFLESDAPEMAPVFSELAKLEGSASQAYEALANLRGGAGLPLLLRTVGSRAASARDADLAIAIAIRRWGREVPRTEYDRAIAWLRSVPVEGGRRVLLRALARDSAVAPNLVRDLRSPRASVRSSAARGLEWLGDESTASALVEALREERVADVFRDEARALLRLGASVPLAIVSSRIDDPSTAPEAMRLAGRQLPSRFTTPAARAIREQLRRGLRSHDPRMRAAAAEGLSLANDRVAHRALVLTLDDPVTEVRWAALRALGELRAPESIEAIEARARLEEDLSLRAALHETAVALRRGDHPAPPRGAFVTLHAVNDGSPEGFEVVFPGGPWLVEKPLLDRRVVVVEAPSRRPIVRALGAP